MKRKIVLIATAFVLALTVAVIPQGLVMAKSKIPTAKPTFSKWKPNDKTKTPKISYTAKWKKVKAYEYRYCFYSSDGKGKFIDSHGYTTNTSVPGTYKANASVLKQAKKKGVLKVTVEVNVRVCNAKGHQGVGKTAKKSVTWKYNKKKKLWYRK